MVWFFSFNNLHCCFCRYFACGSLQRHIASTYRVSKQAFGGIIDQVCIGIYTEMKDELPSLTKEQWLNVSNKFNHKWNFPNCLGAIDGRHCNQTTTECRLAVLQLQSIYTFVLP